MYYATVIFCSIFFVFFHFGSRNISRQKDQNNRLFTETYIRLYLNIACLFFLVIHFLCKKKTVKQNMFLISAHVFLFSWLRKEIKRRNYFHLSSILVLFDSSPCTILLTFPLWSHVWILLTFGDAKSVRLTISSPVSVRIWNLRWWWTQRNKGKQKQTK